MPGRLKYNVAFREKAQTIDCRTSIYSYCSNIKRTIVQVQVNGLVCTSSGPDII